MITLFFSRKFKDCSFIPASYVKQYLSLGIISINKNEGVSFIIYKQKKLGNLRCSSSFYDTIL